MMMKLTNGRSRLRNRFFRWLGLLPTDDFVEYADDVFEVLDAIEKFTKRSTMVTNEICKEIGVVFLNGQMYKIGAIPKEELEKATSDSISRGEL